jgi:hypothetical protein
MNNIVAGIVLGSVLLAPTFSLSENFRQGSYLVAIPDDWRKFDTRPGAPFHTYYEASGTFLPAAFNDGPVIVTAWIMDAEGSALADARKLTIQGYTQNPNRVFESGFTHEEEKLKLKSGEDAYLINTRFYRKDKGLNQSRFDLLAFSNKKIGILYTISISYPDPTYQFEKKYQLKEKVKQLFASFEFR